MKMHQSCLQIKSRWGIFLFAVIWVNRPNLTCSFLIREPKQISLKLRRVSLAVMDSSWICTSSILFGAFINIHTWERNPCLLLSSAERLHWSMGVLTPFLIHFPTAQFPGGDLWSRTKTFTFLICPSGHNHIIPYLCN